MSENEHPTTGELDTASELTLHFAETAQALFAAGSVETTLQRVVDLAVGTIEGCDFAGIFLREGDAVVTPVYTDPIVAEVDSLQHRIGEGPCLDALAHGGTFYADDLAEDSRWRRFGPEAVAAGMRSLAAVSIFSDVTPGALNLYARYPRAFGVIDRARGLILAGLAGGALSSAQSREDDERRSDNLQRALETRELIGQAKGILMERERVTAEEAFDILRRASQHLNIKLREVARSLVDTGEAPET